MSTPIEKLTAQFNQKMTEAHTILEQIKTLPVTTGTVLPKDMTVSGDLDKPLMTVSTAAPELKKGETFSRDIFYFEPLQKRPDSVPFTITEAVTSYGDWLGDHVVMAGHNMNPGGGARVPGEPGIGWSMEQHYKPDGTALGLTEYHVFWIRPDGVQIRLYSFTVNNATNDIDFYHTVSRIYEKDQTGFVWHSIMRDEKSNTIVEHFSGPDFHHQVNHDGQGMQFNTGGKPLVIADPIYTVIANALFHQKYTEISGPVKFTGPVTFTQKPTMP